jgi:hypothetical protein
LRTRIVVNVRSVFKENVVREPLTMCSKFSVPMTKLLYESRCAHENCRLRRQS